MKTIMVKSGHWGKKEPDVEINIMKSAGQFCVHKTLFWAGSHKHFWPNKYTISHLKTGLALIHDLSKPEALKRLDEIKHIEIPEPFDLNNPAYIEKINELKRILGYPVKGE